MDFLFWFAGPTRGIISNVAFFSLSLSLAIRVSLFLLNQKGKSERDGGEFGKGRGIEKVAER